jgi:uncharacterized membrane protein
VNTPGGHAAPPRSVVIGIGIVTALSSLAPLAGAQDGPSPPEVNVQEAHGTYSVRAGFHVLQPPSVVFAVLTDYEDIPRFMADIKTSKVLERSAGGAVVEQEGISRFWSEPASCGVRSAEITRSSTLIRIEILVTRF